MSDFEWPWEYNFPPFFTIQPHVKTREQQLTTWTNLVLAYHKHNKQAVINLNEDTPLFNNETIKRKLSLEGRMMIFDQLEKTGNAFPLDKKRHQWEVYWHTLDEWANIIYNWISDIGMTNTVCTIFELTSGDNSVDQEFYGLEHAVIVKALRILENKNKCELFDDAEGVKFF